MLRCRLATSVPPGDLAAAGLCAAVFTAWMTVTSGRFSLAVLAFFCAYMLVVAVAGSLAAALLPAAVSVAGGLPLRLLVGYLAVNSALFFLAALLPLPLPWTAAIVALGVLVWAGASQRGGEPSAPAFSVPELACVVLCLVATTLWCRDALSPFEAAPGGWTVKPWQDSFTHARLVAMVAFAEGRGTWHNFLLASRPAPFYHYASYFSPAALVACTQVRAFAAFTAFQVPAGVLLSGLAAFAFASALWGRWAGLSASAALLLLPDAAQQGVGNHFFSYHWLQQIAPAGAYGVAVAALAWACLFAGCRSGRWPPILAGWGVAALCLFYKAHIFVANAFLWWIYPALFLAGLPRRRRAAWMGGALALFAITVRLAQLSPRIPPLRLDGSALIAYSRMVLDFWDGGGPLRRLFVSSAPPAAASALYSAPWAATLIAVVTFGFLLPACLAAVALVWRRESRPVVLFPLFVLGNYLLMAVGLAFNRGGAGMPEDLLHRPFVWTWFATCVWTAGAACHAFSGASPLPGRRARWTLALLALLGLATPFRLGPGIQDGPRFGARVITTRYLLPRGLAAACDYLRRAAGRQDIVQDSANDPRGMVTGLSERQAFVVDMYRPPPGFASYRAQADALRRLSSVAALGAFSRRTGVRWYLLRPRDRVDWPPPIVARPAFAAEGYRVYRLPGS